MADGLAANEVLINAEVITLTDKQRKMCINFNKARHQFAWYKNGLMFLRPGDERDHLHWLYQDEHIPIEIFEELPRGYMVPNSIYLYTGSIFDKADIKTISIDEIKLLAELNHNAFGSKAVNLYNGLWIGEPGEIWKPIDHVMTIIPNQVRILID